MSEIHAWLDTIIGATGAVADVGIVLMMWRESSLPKPERRFWPWLVAIVAVTILAAGPAVYRLVYFGSFTHENVAFLKWPSPYNPTSVVAKHFTRERVPLDGYAYSGCTFNEVTFVYNGTTTIQMSHSTIIGESSLTTDNPAVTGTIFLLRGLGALKEAFNVSLPPGNIIEPPVGVPQQ
jgi:hypothetical protein